MIIGFRGVVKIDELTFTNKPFYNLFQSQFLGPEALECNPIDYE